MTNDELDGLLTVLRKHNVVEYSNDQFGTKVRFGDEPTVEAATKTLERALTEYDAVKPSIPAPDLPPPGAVETAQVDLDDVLFGAK